MAKNQKLSLKIGKAFEKTNARFGDDSTQQIREKIVVSQEKIFSHFVLHSVFQRVRCFTYVNVLEQGMQKTCLTIL